MTRYKIIKKSMENVNLQFLCIDLHNILNTSYANTSKRMHNLYNNFLMKGEASTIDNLQENVK